MSILCVCGDPRVGLLVDWCLVLWVNKSVPRVAELADPAPRRAIIVAYNATVDMGSVSADHGAMAPTSHARHARNADLSGGRRDPDHSGRPTSRTLTRRRLSLRGRARRYNGAPTGPALPRVKSVAVSDAAAAPLHARSVRLVARPVHL